MTTVTCKNCGQEIEITAALQGQIEEQVLKAEHQKHQAEMEQVRLAAAEKAKRDSEVAIQVARRQLAGEAEIAKKEADAELALAKKRFESEAISLQKKTVAEQEMAMKQLQEEAVAEKVHSKELREKLSELMVSLREERRARENTELEMHKKLASEEGKIRQSATKEAEERQRLHIAERVKTISDLQKSLADAQRKAAQGSQQLQGEIMELDLEEALMTAFRDDDVIPVAKGVKGGDIKQVVKSPGGVGCGIILWEIKRTKNWTDTWIPKLKQDLRNEKANIPIIVSEVMPKQINEDMGHLNGVWICRPALTIILATLLRKSLLDAGAQKALAQNRGTKADALFSFVTSHEFVQQIESMVETYQEMTTQVVKEKAAFEKIWAQRQAQAERLLLSTASIIGSMQGHVGQSSMPRIKGLELLEAGSENDQINLL
jgi:hypothetical protein